MTDDDLPAGRVVVGIWQRRTGRTGHETVKLVRAGSRWFVRRRVGPHVDLREHPNRALAHAAIAVVVGEAWVYYPPPCRHGPKHRKVAVAS